MIPSGVPGTPLVPYPEEDRPDAVYGIITAPRVAPHRSGRQPAKSCLKTASRPRSGAGTAKSHGEVGALRWDTQNPYTVTGRCIITGRHVIPRWRAPKEFRRERNMVIRAMSPEDRLALKAVPNWTSDCDAPMTGMSEEQDLAAAQHQAEEDELDRRIAEARVNWQRNKADCPIPNKTARSRHPAVVESKRWRAYLAAKYGGPPEHC
ncbi:hypothetical protein B0T16DRAFT_319909 [Cercophora newfieldiana]|uniref:Uncharacterized protein n=1 Tax=Cercophora newfieldiana TaxID=92897 RepID=A0AA39YSS9_9PEZI|nr:hypothetical protein B0T16DRAFT_319909 [Cercophora newfieldiana]